jgi:hypothetical protein
MQFRWVIGITLWTVLIGPVLGPPLPRSSDNAEARSPSSNRPFPKATPHLRR